MEKKVLLVINPNAGQKKANRVLTDIIRTICDEGFQCETYVTNSQGDATRYIEEHAKEYVRIICIGGDGTLNETIAGVLANGSKTPVGYIPAGTTNDYATSIGLSADPVQAAHDAAGSTSRMFDMGLFNDRSFTYTASFGAFTRVSYSTPQPMKNMFGHLAYVLAGIADLGSLKPHHARVKADGVEIEGDYILGVVSNATSIGGVLKLDARRVSLNDGLFEVMLIHMPNSIVELTQILNALSTQQVPCDTIEFFPTSQVTFDFDEETEWTLDGERADPTDHVEIQNLNNAIRLYLPVADEGEELIRDDESEDELQN